MARFTRVHGPAAGGGGEGRAKQHLTPGTSPHHRRHRRGRLPLHRSQTHCGACLNLRTFVSNSSPLSVRMDKRRVAAARDGCACVCRGAVRQSLGGRYRQYRRRRGEVSGKPTSPVVRRRASCPAGGPRWARSCRRDRREITCVLSARRCRVMCVIGLLSVHC